MEKLLGKILCSTLLIFAVFISLFATGASAAGEPPITVFVDGSEVRFSSPPIVENGRPLVPMRAIFEALDMEVTWLPAERSVMAVGGDFMSYVGFTIDIGSKEMKSGGETILLDTPVRLLNGTVFVPLRAVSEGTGAKVVWIEEERRVLIASGKRRGEAAIIPKDTWLYDWLSESDKVEYGDDAAVITQTGTDPYFVLFEWIYDLDPGLNDGIKYIAVDMTETKATDNSHYIALMKTFCNNNGLILLEDTYEGLLEKGLIKRDLEYPRYTYFDEGILITFKDISLSESKLATSVNKSRSSSGAIGGRYVLEKLNGL